MLRLDEDNRKLVVDSAIKNKVSKDVIDLYEQIHMAIELMNSDDFEIVDSCIINDIVRFEITTQCPEGLPEELGILVFNVDTKFNIDLKETALGKCFGLNMRHYKISFKKN